MVKNEGLFFFPFVEIFLCLAHINKEVYLSILIFFFFFAGKACGEGNGCECAQKKRDRKKSERITSTFFVWSPQGLEQEKVWDSPIVALEMSIGLQARGN